MSVEPLAALTDCHIQWRCLSSICTWCSGDGGTAAPWLIPTPVEKSTLIKISTLDHSFYYQFTQSVRTLSIKVLGPRWTEMRAWMVADKITNAHSTQFILRTIRSNLLHANSSLRFQRIFFNINSSCHSPLSASLYFHYTADFTTVQVIDSYSFSHTTYLCVQGQCNVWQFDFCFGNRCQNTINGW